MAVVAVQAIPMVAVEPEDILAPTVGPVVKDPHNPLLVEDRLYDVRWDNTYM